MSRPLGACLIRAGSGYLHIAIPTGRGYDTACCRTVRSTRIRVWLGHRADDEWRIRLAYRCPDCAALRSRGWLIIRRVAGW